MLLHLCGLDADGLYPVLHIREVLDASKEGLTLVWKDDEECIDISLSEYSKELIQGSEKVFRRSATQVQGLRGSCRFANSRRIRFLKSFDEVSKLTNEAIFA